MMFSFGPTDIRGFASSPAPKLNFVSPVLTPAEDRGHEIHRQRESRTNIGGRSLLAMNIMSPILLLIR